MFSRVFEDLLADDTLTGLVARFADHATEHACTGLFQASARPLRPGGSTASWDEVRFGRHLAPVTGPESPHPRAEPLGVVRRQCALASIKLYKDVPAAHLFLDPTPDEDVRRRAETLLAQELLDLGTLIANTREYLAASALLGRIDVNERTVPGSDVAFTVEFGNRRARALTPWSDPNTRLRSAELLRLKRLFKDEAGRRAGVALTEPGVDSAFVQNEELKAYAARKLGAEILANLELTGTNPQWEGLAGLSWRFTDGTYRPEGGAVTRYFPRETVVVLPEAERLKDVLGWAEGRVFVPRGPRHVLDVQLVTDAVRERRGVYAYAEVRTDPCAIRIYAGWTGLPVVLDPSAVLVYRTAVPAGVP